MSRKKFDYSDNSECFDKVKEKRHFDKWKMFVKRSCKPELITNLNDLEIEEDIELTTHENIARGISEFKFVS